MAKVYSWEVSNSPKKYAYIVHPDDYNKAYVGTELKGTKLEKVKDWVTVCTDTQYEEQFDKMVALCKSKGYNVEFETAIAYMDVESTCDNLRGPAGRGIDHITLKDIDEFRNVSIYEIVYDDGETDTFEIRNGKDGQNGRDGRDGAQGDAGVSSKLIMIYTSGIDSFGNIFTPARPTGGSYNFDTYEFTRPDDGVWNLNDSDLTPPIWMSSRTFSSSPASTDKEWSSPVQLTGESGKPGVDGVSTEFIYYRDRNEPNVENLDSPNEAGYVPPKETGWTASPQGVDEDNLTEWASTRKLDRTTNVWGKWSKAFRWSQYGVNGQDGDGVHYIYLKNAGQIVENPTPANYKTNENYQNRDNEWIPTAGVTYTNINGIQVKYSALEERTDDLAPAGIWTDNPSDLTANFHSQWVCSRKYRKGSNGKMAWDKFSDPALWARYGQDGKNATSIRKLYALSSDTKTYPPIPEDTTATSEWGSGFPKDYEVGENVVWAIEAEIWAHNFEFVKTYKIVSGVDEDGNVVPPADATMSNTIDVESIPNEEVKGYDYIRLNGDYYAWSGGWGTPYIVTGVKGESGDPINYTTYVYAFGHTNYPPEPPTGTSPKNPGESTDGLNYPIVWRDFPDSKVGMDGDINDDTKEEMRWYQCVGFVNGRTGEIESWSNVQPCNGHDGAAGPQGNRTEVRFGVTADSTKPILVQKDETFGEIKREPELYDSKGNKMGWFATDEKLPEVPSGGAMWQIWALIDGATDTVIVQNGRGWNGPVRVSGEKGEQGIQGPAGMRGVTGIPGATSIQMYCLGTYGKDEKSESYWETGGIDGGDGYFGSDMWTKNALIDDMDGWFIAKDMPYSNIIKVYNDEELNVVSRLEGNAGRVVNLIETSDVNVGATGSESTFTHTTNTYYLISKDGGLQELTHALDSSEEFNVYVWCIQGNEVWKSGSYEKYVDITRYDNNGNVIPPEDSDDNNTIDQSELPIEKDEFHKYIRYNNKYYEWKEVNGDKVQHVLEKIEWGSPFKLQGTNGLRGLSGTRGQVVYPMGVYNSEEVYITNEAKAPYVYDPNDGMYYVYNNTERPWVGRLPGYNPDTREYDETVYKSVMIHPDDAESSFKSVTYDPKTQREEVPGYKYLLYEADGNYYIWSKQNSCYTLASKYKYSIDGSGADGTWMPDQHGDAPANNYANAINANETPQWVRFESFEALYTSIGIIENGMIGSAVYNNEFMFSQQGIGQDGNPTNYAVVSATGTEYGFLSGYEYDEKGEYEDGRPTGRHWKYSGTGTYINNTDVDPYEKKNGQYIHTFMPNVCINFATGQMWTSCGKAHFNYDGTGYLADDSIRWGYEAIDDNDPNIKTIAFEIGELGQDGTGDGIKYHNGNLTIGPFESFTANVNGLVDSKASIFTSMPTTKGPDGYLYHKNDLWILESDYTPDETSERLGKGAKKSSIWTATQSQEYDSLKENNGFSWNHWSKTAVEFDEWIENTYSVDAKEIRKQVDQKANTYYQPNDPATNWSDSDKSANKGDLWYNTNEQQTYYWNGTTWTLQDVPKYLFDQLDGKSSIFVSKPKDDHDNDGFLYHANDLWILEDNFTKTDELNSTGTRGSLWVSKNDRKTTDTFQWTDWVKKGTELDDWVTNIYDAKITNIQGQIDGKAETHYQDTDPSGGWKNDDEKDKHVGDLWYCTVNITDNEVVKYEKGGTYIYEKDGKDYKWSNCYVPSEVFDKIDGKSSIFTSKPSSYQKNDLWILSKKDTALDGIPYKEGEILTATVSSSTYKPKHWVRKCCYTDDTTANNALSKAQKVESNQTQIFNDLDGVKNDLKNKFGNVVQMGAALTGYIGITDDSDKPTLSTCLNGSNLGRRNNAGNGWRHNYTKLAFAAGIPDQVTIDETKYTYTTDVSDDTLDILMTNAKTRIYEDGSAIFGDQLHASFVSGNSASFTTNTGVGPVVRASYEGSATNGQAKGISIKVPDGYAIYCIDGVFAGLRPKTRYVTTEPVNLDDFDYTVIVNGTTTINLPSEPKDGQTYEIYAVKNIDFTINATEKYQIFKLNSGLTASSDSFSKSDYYYIKLTFSKSFNKWIEMYQGFNS